MARVFGFWLPAALQGDLLFLYALRRQQHVATMIVATMTVASYFIKDA